MLAECKQCNARWVWSQRGSVQCMSAVMSVTVGHLCWHRFWWAQHAVSYSLPTMQKGIANGGGYVGEWCYAAEDLPYQTELLCSFYLLQFPWKWIGGITFTANIGGPGQFAFTQCDLGKPTGWTVVLYTRSLRSWVSFSFRVFHLPGLCARKRFPGGNL